MKGERVGGGMKEEVFETVCQEQKVEENAARSGEKGLEITVVNGNSGIDESHRSVDREAGREARNESCPLAEFTAFSSERAEPLIPSTPGFQLATLAISRLAGSNSI